MKKYILLKLVIAAFFCIALSASACAQKKDVTAIRSLMAEQVKAWNNGDIDVFMQGYWKSDSLLFVGSKGPTYGWQTTLENYKKRYPDTTVMGKLDFTILETELLSADHAFVLGKWHLARTIGDVGGYFTLIFRKINGQWFIIADHTS